MRGNLATSQAQTPEGPAPPALTATLTETPGGHDGTAFTFKLRFSEEVELSYLTLRDSVLTAEGGRVTEARRLEKGSNRGWQITLDPDSADEEVLIQLLAKPECDAVGAVCTADGRPLSNSYLVLVPVAPAAVPEPPPSPTALTASFEAMPAAHDGSEFAFGLTFSEEPSLGYLTLRDQALSVSGGTVREAKRKVKGSNLKWEITVEPNSNGAVAITLPSTSDCSASGAICTSDGRGLSNSPSATVSGPGEGKLVTSSEATSLAPNFPNPFNNHTQLAYRLARPGQVRLEIYNALGHRLRTLVDAFQPAGAYQVGWDARAQGGGTVASGVYFARLYHAGGVHTRRLLYLR